MSTEPQPTVHGVSSQAGLASLQDATPARAGVPVRLIDPAAIDVEALARVLAGLGPDEDWPTNEALGGSLTGTRDDEFRDAMVGQAEAVKAHLTGGVR